MNQKTDILCKEFVICALFVLSQCAPHVILAQKQDRRSVEERILSDFASKADSCVQIGKNEEALKYIHKAYNSVRRPPKYTSIFYRLKYTEGYALLLLNKPEYERAIEAFKIVLRDKERGPDFYSELGWAYLKKGDYASAIQYLGMSIQNELARDSIEYYYVLRSEILLATAYMKNGEDDKASEVLDSFLDKRDFLNHDDYFNLLLRAYNDIVVDDNGNILSYDKVSLRILQELVQDTRETDGYPSWYYVIWIGQEGQVAQELGNSSLAYECAINAINSYTPDCGIPLQFHYCFASRAASGLKRYEEAHQYLERAFALVGKEDSTNRLFWVKHV